MKLQCAMPFVERMVLRQNKNIPVWGTSCNNDTITVQIDGQCVSAQTQNGKWSLELQPLKATNKTTMTVSSAKTGEVITFNDVAVGEVILAGGQSNMEFILKYDNKLDEALAYEDDHDLRYFCVPQSAYIGFTEKQPTPDWGYWRTFEEAQDRKMFSAVACYLGIKLRQALNVPVGIISCNWGGTPATAWIKYEDILANPDLKPVLDWQAKANENTKWEGYIKTAFTQTPPPSEQMLAFRDKFMLGQIDMGKLFENGGPPPMNPEIYNDYLPGPLACIRPAGLYDNMLCKVAPYPVSFVIWWQGEDDDARDWVDFYDESMKTLIQSWRNLFKEELPFFQVELAPFRGVGPTGAKLYDVIRHKQYQATASLERAYDICILDAGEEFNIHPRHKKVVGDRLAGYALKYVYHKNVNADCPIFDNAKKTGNEIELSFKDTFGAITVTDKIKDFLLVQSGGQILDYTVEIRDDKLIIKGEFTQAVTIKYAESNYAEACIFNSEGNPLFGFTVTI